MGKQIIKKWKAVLLFLVLFVGTAWITEGGLLEVHAEDEGYYITDYHVDALVHENAVVDVTEKITVHFNEEKHGIFRDIPLKMIVNREVNGNVRKYVYRIKISDIQVEGAPYQLKKADGCRRIIIGDKDNYVTGDQTYQIRYKVDMGDDRISEFDEFFYTMIGDGWEVPAENVSFQVEFEKDADLSNTHIYVGPAETKEEGRTDSYLEGNRITGTVAGVLAPHEAVTIFTRLPEGYFTGARKESILPVVILTFLSILLTLFVVIRYLKRRNTLKVVETVEFYPPEGLSSAEVGYVIDGRADQKDILSLIFWLAHRGYLSIKGKEEKDITLHKEKELPADMPQHIRIFFNGLFAEGDELKLSEPGKKTAEAVQEAQTALPAYFFGERKLTHPGVMGKSVLLGLFSGILLAGGVGAANVFLTEMDFVQAVLTVVFYSMFLVIMVSQEENRAFVKKRAVMLVRVLFLAAAVVGCFAGIYSALFPLFVPVLYVCGVICAFCTARTQAPTSYKTELTGKLLGFRNFIEKAEIPKLEELVNQDPEYFYDVLPYAYVFGLTDAWAKKFENIALEPPQWWIGYNHMEPFTTMYLVHSMTRYTQDFSHQVYQINAPSSSSFTSSSGGYSGGGFGGGGGGAW